MKKLSMFLLLLVALIAPAKADTVLDQLYGGFVGRAKMAIESTTDGTNHAEFLVNYLEIGQVKNGHIAALDAGVVGTFLPDNDHFRAADWSAGGKLHLAPLIRSYVTIPSDWEALLKTDLDFRASYDFRERHPFYGIVAAYPFE